MSRPDLGRQAVRGPEPLGGCGLRFIAVDHIGNINTSEEETARVVELVAGFLDGGPTWVDRHGDEHDVGLEEILVVAPYNAHVSALRAALPEGARVGHG